MFEKYIDVFKGREFNDINSFIVIFEDGEEVSYFNAPCYGALSRQECGTEYILSSTYNHKISLSEDKCIKYLDWLLNHSPYSRVFIDKDASECLDRGFVSVSGRTPSNLMLGGLIAVRRLYEYSSVVEAFDILVEGGVKPNLAYLIAHRSRVVEEGSGISFNSFTTSHVNLNHSFDKEYIMNFVNNNPTEKDSYYDTGRYGGVDSTWGTVTQKCLMHSLLSGLGDEDKMALRENNPFYKYTEWREKSLNKKQASLPVSRIKSDLIPILVKEGFQ